MMIISFLRERLSLWFWFFITLLLSLSFVLSLRYESYLPDLIIDVRHDGHYEPNYVAEDENTIEFIYIGSSDCPFCNRREFPSLVDSAITNVKKIARRRGYGFISKGITTDRVPYRGIEHLNNIGKFEEIIVGNGLENMALKKYFWGELAGRAATPQVMVVYKNIVLPDSSSDGSLRLKNVQIVARKYGPGEIRRWVERNTPLSVID